MQFDRNSGFRDVNLYRRALVRGVDDMGRDIPIVPDADILSWFLHQGVVSTTNGNLSGRASRVPTRHERVHT